MKKRFFATLALLASMALVGCGKKTCEKHQWGSWEQTVAPTCQKEGKKVRTCKVCGTKDEQDVAKANHEWESDPARAADNRAATCSQAGVEYQKCKNCGATNENTIPQLEHTWDDGVASGDCGEAGTVTYTCTMCKTATKSETSGYIQHSWVKTGSVDAGDGGLAYD